MITVSLRQHEHQYVSFEISGHANFAEYGSDIVCAGVSALAITCINSIEKLASYQPLLETNDEAGGYLYCEVPKDLNEKQVEVTQILIQSLVIGLKDMEKEYHQYIRVKVA